jgi:formylglycine-generating enzyme required for sulfatase activity/pimeloyl-ACP methyl ester carboxylesterase
VVDVLTQNIPLPSWVFLMTLGLLVAALPVILATAYLQASEDPSEEEAGGSGGVRSFFTWSTVVRGAIAAMAVWGVAVTGWLAFGRDTAGEWDVVAGLEEIERLTNDAEFRAAYDIALELEDGVADDSVRAVMWGMVSRPITIRSEPEGARVLRRDFAPAGAPWEELGTTPVTIERYPFGRSRLRLELEGYTPREVAWTSGMLFEFSPIELTTDETVPAGMVRVEGGSTPIFAPGLEQLPQLELGSYHMGIHEVTNAEFKEFVDAGGYDESRCWLHAFEDDGESITFEEAVGRMTDLTGRPGPSTWEAGSYPTGTADHPVSGVSWYEAEAYACWRGMALPTVYHWYWEADPLFGGHVVPLSNYAGEGSAPVGSFDGMTASGTLDMAGNVREWTRNSDGEGRFILGGAWADPRYAFNDAVTSPPFDRSPFNGFRLAEYLDTLNVSAASAIIEPQFRDYAVEQPVSDEVFEVYRELFAYDRTALNVRVVSTDTTDLYIRQRIDMDPAYDGPPLTVFVFVPNDRVGPFQPIVYFPGSDDLYRRDFAQLEPFDFLLQSGRAFIYPAYLGTWERDTELNSDIQNESALYRDHVAAWVRDFGRTVDYLETRDDMQMDALGYFGFSGLMMQSVQPSADPLNFLPRVTQPTLMFNGRYDSFFPLETSIQPYFELLGTPEEQKRLVVVDSNHFVWSFNRNQLIQEVLDWYDRWLGEVPRRSGG